MYVGQNQRNLQLSWIENGSFGKTSNKEAQKRMKANFESNLKEVLMLKLFSFPFTAIFRCQIAKKLKNQDLAL